MQELYKDAKSSDISKEVKGLSKTAEGVTMVRAMESKKPVNERICYDQYAIRFISLEKVRYYIEHRAEVKAMMDQMPTGVSNSIVARVRFFDDIVKSMVNDGLEQLVILGAGYDTRAYRIEGLNKIKVFEVDLPNMQKIKIEKIREIFGSLPEHVIYISMDLEVDELDQQLKENEYDSSKKTLFIMEGLTYYLHSDTVDNILSFIVNNSVKGSAILFDYHPKSMIDGTCKLEVAKSMRKTAISAGEPHQFGINVDAIESFLIQRGFSQIQNVTSEDYKKAYFHGKNRDRKVNKLSLFAYATVK